MGIDMDMGWKLGAGTAGELVAFPPAVEPVQNEWYERDGVETSGDPLVEGDKVVAIRLVGLEPMDSFVAHMRREGGYKGRLEGVPWSVDLRPREVAYDDREWCWPVIRMLDVGDTFPREEISPLTTAMALDTTHTIGGISFGAFGVKVLGVERGSEVVRAFPEGAKGLTIGAYRVQVRAFMRVGTRDIFVRNRNALLYQLTHTSDLALVLRGEARRGYYVSCATEWYVEEQSSVMWNFILTLMITR